MTLDSQALVRLPKVSLHDHLDGGLRPQTVVDLCRENGHPLPTHDADALQEWIYQQCDAGSLVDYLKPFELTVAAMQTAEQLQRVAEEFVLDMAADGVVHAETRWAPHLHQRLGLGLDEAVLAVAQGLEQGMARAEAAGTPVVARQILAAMRQQDRSLEVAELVVRHRDAGVVAFDLAGPEDGFPPSRHAAAFAHLREHDAHWTIHAGEAYGLPSIREAVHGCGTRRLGHGVRIVDAIDRSGEVPVLGPLAAWVRDERVLLEVAPSSNLQTGIAATMAEHPVGLLAELGFRINISCDNRLMSRTTLSQELGHLVEAFGWDLAMLRRVAIDSMRGAFLPHPEREAVVEQVLVPAYA